MGGRRAEASQVSLILPRTNALILESGFAVILSIRGRAWSEEPSGFALMEDQAYCVTPLIPK